MPLMRSPSARVLGNSVDVFVGAASQDIDGGLQVGYTSPTMTGVPCSVQFRESLEVVDDQQRIAVANSYHILFGQPQNLTPRDLILWTDTDGILRKLFIDAAPPSEAGRGGTYVVRCSERV